VSQGCVTKLAWLRSGLLSGGKATLAPPDDLEQDIAVTFAVSATKPSFCARTNSCCAKDLSIGHEDSMRRHRFDQLSISATTPVLRASGQFGTLAVYISSWLGTVDLLLRNQIIQHVRRSILY
jgi:hypothetical protein